MDSLLVVVLAAIGGASGLGALISAVYRARSGRAVDEADAADKIVSGAAEVVGMLRSEIREARNEILECRAVGVRAELEARAARVATELCEKGRTDDQREMAEQAGQLAILSARLLTVEAAVGTLPQRGDRGADS